MTPGLLTGIFSIGEKLIDHWFPNAEDKDKRKAELFSLIHQGKMTELESAANVIMTEAKSDHWIVASWRPITMLTFVFIIANNYIIFPYLSLFWESAPKLDIPTDLWDLIKIGLGGYVVSRGGEKMMKEYKS